MLTLRLLAAARHAYQIDTDGSVPDTGWPPAPSTYIGYTTAPVGFRAGLDNQDGAFVATIPEGVVVSIRGTTPPRLFGSAPAQVVADWASDAVASLIPSGGQPPGFPGKVHLGFYKSFMRLWPDLGPATHAQVAAYSAANPGAAPQTIYVTGHSKGGAISALVGWRLKCDFPAANIVVRSFAGARIGDDDFATAYNAQIPDHARYEFDDDIVPHLPLSPDIVKNLGLPTLLGALLSVADIGYGLVGRLGFIHPDGSIEGDSDGLEDARMARLIDRVRQPGGLGYIVNCHSVDPPTAGYFIAQYPN
ncbi:MAG TPA: lipase family protein [Phenylobacterium sp.]|jgi:hypothetical protein|nr:lipase family protein [Phenylobacterium sp.]